jgi:hypothetical protein
MYHLKLFCHSSAAHNHPVVGFSSHLQDGCDLADTAETGLRLIYGVNLSHHITLLLHDFNWLKAPVRLAHKLAIQAHCCFHGFASAHLASELHHCTNI